MEYSTLDGKPLTYRLLEFRSIPISGTLQFPLQILTKRVPHSVLPHIPATVTANMPQIQQYHEELMKCQGISQMSRKLPNWSQVN